MNDVMTGVLVVLGTIVVVAGLGLLLAFPIKWTWNYVIPHLFNLGEITWGQAWCIHFLAGCLIKSSSSSGSKK